MFYRSIFSCFVIGIIATSLWITYPVQADSEPNLVAYQIGTGQAEITPLDWQERIYWMAGYGIFRPATSVHDPLMARALVIDDGISPLLILTTDLLGLTSDDADYIQSVILASVPDFENRILVHATHQHEGPDVIGIWGGAGFPFANPRPQDYMDYIAAQAAVAAAEAWANRQPVSVTFASIEHDPLLTDLVHDSRDPQVHDSFVRLMVFHNESGNVATLVNWASHPEALGSENEAMTADFVKWVIDELEETGWGDAIYVNGAIGGLLSSNGVIPELPDDSFEEAEAVGRQVSQRLVSQLANPGPHDVVETYSMLPPLQFRQREYYLPIENRALAFAQLIERVEKQSFYQFQIPAEEWYRSEMLARYTNTETSFIKIGPAAILTMGGELYPELLVGGVVPIGDPPFNTYPAETPLISNPVFEDYSFKFFFGLTNDFHGYVVPVQEWDGWDGEYGEDFALSHDQASLLNYNMHLLMLGFETGEYPGTGGLLPAWLVRPTVVTRAELERLDLYGLAGKSNDTARLNYWEMLPR